MSPFRNYKSYFWLSERELKLHFKNSYLEETRHNNFLSHQFQINHQLFILRHAYLHKTSNYETILNNNKVLINLLSLYILWFNDMFKFMIIRTLATIAKYKIMIYQSAWKITYFKSKLSCSWQVTPQAMNVYSCKATEMNNMTKITDWSWFNYARKRLTLVFRILL